MKKLILILVLSAVAGVPLSADTVAFGYFENVSKNLEYEFLRTVLPNSLSSALASEYEFTVFKPSEVDQILIEKGYDRMQSQISVRDIPELGRKIKKADFIVTGFYKLKDERNIEVTVSIYDIHGNEFLTFSVGGPFSTSGKTSTEVFNLVDGLTESFNLFITQDHMYQESDVLEKSSLGFITNLNPDELNSLYRPFMENGYSIIPLQLCETENHLENDPFVYKLKYFSLKKTEIDKFESETKQFFYYSPAIGQTAMMYQDTVKKLIARYYFGISEQTAASLKRLNDSCKSNIDYLIVLLFNPEKNEAMIRVFDCRRFDQKIIWVQDRIKGNGLDSDRITDVAKNVIKKSVRDKKTVR
jgi:hypothetical protein